MSVNVEKYIPSDTGHTPHDHLLEHTIVANSVLVRVFCCTQSLFVSHVIDRCYFATLPPSET